MPTEETPIVSMAQFADAFDISYDDTDPVANRAVTLEQARRYVNSLNTSDNFPQDFTELEYIESNGSQALDTGYNPNSNTRVILDYNLTQLTGKWMGIFAARDGQSSGFSNQYAYWSNETGVYRSNYSGKTGILFGSQNTNRHIIDKDKAVLKEDGIVVADHPAATFSCNYNLYIFCGNSAGTLEHYARMRLYSCKIYDNGVLVRDYVPVKRNRDSAIGLYDRVQRTFNTSATSTSFIAGTVVEQDHSDLENKVMTIKQLSTLSKKTLGKRLLEYVQFTGTQFIDTGYNPNGETRVVLDIYLDQNQPTANNGIVSIFGGRTSTTASSFTLWRLSSSQFRYDYKNTLNTINLSATGDFSIDANKNIIKINSTTKTVTKSTFQSTHSLRLGSTYTNTGSPYNDSNFNDLRRFSGKVYSMKIYDNGTLVRDLKPVKDLKTGQIGFYDILSGIFYENNGTGSFGAGPEVGYI